MSKKKGNKAIPERENRLISTKPLNLKNVEVSVNVSNNSHSFDSGLNKSKDILSIEEKKKKKFRKDKCILFNQNNGTKIEFIMDFGQTKISFHFVKMNL